MTAQVTHDLGADIQAVVEAENEPSLDRFNTDLLAGQYDHVMLIDGNDTRGIDVGILTSPKSRSAPCAATSTPLTLARPASSSLAVTAPSTSAGCSAGRRCGCW
jgi:hypothetical protein